MSTWDLSRGVAGQALPPVEVVCLGESMIMVTPTPGGKLDGSSVFQLRVGGAESNVAMYLSNLGHHSQWISKVGDDPLGTLVTEQVAEVGVDVTAVVREPDGRTGVYFKDPAADETRVFYYRKESAATLMSRELVEPVARNPPKVLHLSGITSALSNSCKDLMDYLILERALGPTVVSFDVNYRAALWPNTPSRELLTLARGADVVFVGLDEAAKLWNVKTAQDVRDIIAEPQELVVKDGPNEATCFYPEGSEAVAAPVINIVEHVGAGDAFAAGWLSGKLRGLAHRDRLALGHVIAGVSLQSTSDYTVLPPDHELRSAIGVSKEAWGGRSSLLLERE